MQWSETNGEDQLWSERLDYVLLSLLRRKRLQVCLWPRVVLVLLLVLVGIVVVLLTTY